MMSRSVTMPFMTLNPSGGVRVALAALNEIASEGIAVEIIAPDYADESPVDLHRNIRVSVLRAGGGRLRRLRYARALVQKLASMDGLFIAGEYQTPLMISAAGLLGRRKRRLFYIIQADDRLAHIRYGSQPILLKPLLHAAVEIGYRIPAYRISPSRATADRVNAHIHEIVHPGVTRPFLQPLRDTWRNERFVVGILPSRAPVKGFEFALRAFEDLRREGASTDFVVFDGDYETDYVPGWIARFTEHARERGLDADIVSFYRGCDIFVMPSLSEGFGIPPLEAMGMGSAVVVTNCGGPMEYACADENALVVPPADAGALRDAIRRLVANPELRKKLIAEGHRTAHQFTEERWAKRCAAITMELLRGAGRPAPPTASRRLPRAWVCGGVACRGSAALTSGPRSA
ncbi:MAG: glycosyltransferase family 4 protein, partial [bacterium]|nr:glycosyltransferase family 4 protein [bacterium]